MTTDRVLAELIWTTSRADESTISATGANIVADAILASDWLAAREAAALDKVERRIEALELSGERPDEPGHWKRGARHGKLRALGIVCEVRALLASHRGCVRATALDDAVLPEWLTDRERLAKNIFYTTGDGEGLNWQRQTAATRERFLEMADKIRRAVADAIEKALGDSAKLDSHWPPGSSTEPYYSDDLVTLYHGDCLDVMAGLPEASVDTVLTDPPYSSGGRRENARSIRKSMTRRVEDDDWIRGDAMSTPGFVYLLRQCGVEWRRLLRPGGHVLTFIDWRMAPNLGAALETADLRQHPTLVWDKAKIGMGAIFRNQHEFIVHMTAGTPMPPQRRDMPNVLRYPSVRDGDHPTEKPTALLQDLLSVVAPPTAVVLDPFAGSGSTLVAASAFGRRSVGIEADERYCEVTAKRLEQGSLFSA